MLYFDIKKRLRAGVHVFRLDTAFCLEEGSFLGIRGASGSGKTTLLRCLAGLCRPDSGGIRMGGTFGIARVRLFSRLPSAVRSVSCSRTTLSFRT